MKKIIGIAGLTLISFLGFAQSPDEAGIRAACLDYIDAFYRADTTLAYRSVHPKLQKRGFAYSEQNKAWSRQLEMPFPALVNLAKKWNATGQSANANSVREVKILDIEDKTAAAKVTAVWGIDYIHLVKEDGRWWVMNVLWQSLPKKGS
ncbi:MAG TPA: nuclear transport factor 2 family protein [Sphingobacteriaceae bacterium]